jgi:hypothetical protein
LKIHGPDPIASLIRCVPGVSATRPSGLTASRSTICGCGFMSAASENSVS